MLAPNKQNLLILKKQKKSVAKGLKLLKEKQIGLISAFLRTAHEGKQLEQKLSQKLDEYFVMYRHKTTLTSYESIIELLERNAIVEVGPERLKISGVSVKSFSIKNTIPERPRIKDYINHVLAHFSVYLPDLTRIIQTKDICKTLSREIKKVNRQISIIEQQIDKISSQIKSIQAVLQERSNLEKAVLIQLFNN